MEEATATAAPELVVSNGASNMLKCDYESVLAKRRRFIGTAALIEDILPYYDHAKKQFGITTSSPQSAVQKYVQASALDTSHFPEAKVRTVLAHLSDLQFSADGYEAQGEFKRADEVRDVAETMYSMLKTIQLSQLQVHDTGKGNGHSNGNGNRGRS